MKKIKEFLIKINKKVWIIGGILLVAIIVSSWLFFTLKEDSVISESNTNLEVVNENKSSEFTRENVENGEYKNDVSSATTFVQNTQEVKVAVIADETITNEITDVKKVSCGYVSFVTTRIVGPAVLTNSLKALFENKVTTDFVPGNIIPIYHPKLKLDKVMIDDGVAKIYLTGNFSGLNEGWCDASLAIAQIVETAKTFPNIKQVEVYQGGEKIY